MPDPNEQDPQKTEPTPDAEEKKPTSSPRRLKVNGEEREYTEDEILTMAQKFAGGEDKFQQAQKFKEEALSELSHVQGQAELGEALLKMYNEETPQAEKLAQFQYIVQKVGGYSEADAQAMANELMGNTGDAGNAGSNSAAGQGGQQGGHTGMERLEALEQRLTEREQEIEDLRSRQALDDQARLIQVEKEYRDHLHQLVDNDEILGKLTKKVGKRADTVHKHAWKAFEGRIDRANARKENLGPQVFDEVVAEVRALITDAETLGTPKSGSIPGLLPTPAILDEFHPEKPPEVPPVTDPDFKKGIAALLRHKELEKKLEAAAN